MSNDDRPGAQVPSSSVLSAAWATTSDASFSRPPHWTVEQAAAYEIGKRVRRRRELLDLTVDGAADAAGISATEWQEIERWGELPAARLYVVAQGLTCPAYELLPPGRDRGGIPTDVLHLLVMLRRMEPELRRRLLALVEAVDGWRS